MLKKGWLFIFLIYVSIGYMGYPQDAAWLEIVESEEPFELRQRQIETFLRDHGASMNKIQLADCYHDIGNKLYYRNWLTSAVRADLDSAISLTAVAGELKQEVDTLESASLKKTLYNLGYFYSLKGDYYHAIRAYSRVIDAGEEDAKTLAAVRELGSAYMATGDYLKAKDCFSKIVSYYERDSSDRLSLIEAHLRHADNYSAMGHLMFAENIEYHLHKADSLCNLTADETVLDRAQINMLRGNLHVMLENYDQAIDSHNKVMAVSNAFSDENMAVLHNSFGVSYDKLGKTEKALRHLKTAVSLNAVFSDPYENLGDLYRDQKEFERSLEYYQKAIALTSKKALADNYMGLPTKEDMVLSPDKTALLSHLVAKANGWMAFHTQTGKQDLLLQALKTFERADQLIDLIRTESTEFQSKLYWREQSAHLYMQAVEACYLLKKPEEAFHFMERNKALLLLEDITHEQAKQLSGLPDSIAQREFELKRAIHLAENVFKNAAEVGANTLDSLKGRVFDAKLAYDRFADSITHGFPDYTRLKSRLEVLEYDEFKALYCTPDQAVLQYILNDEEGYGLLNTKDSTLFFKLSAGKAFNEQFGRFRQSLTEFSTDSENLAEYRSRSHEVFASLIPEKAYRLIRGKQLILVPDHHLQKIPFEALVIDEKEGRYLIAETEIRYAYSLSYLHAKHHMGSRPSKQLMALAPVEFNTLGLVPLRFSGREITEIREFYAGEVLLNRDATKRRFLEEMDAYNILHLSTHADIDENGNHWVALSDEKLYLDEIYASRNHANMVVLSACNTSSGELVRGEGVMSLARAFFNSGASSVVASLWMVSDRAGKEIMVEFYKGLDQGLTKSAALRRAKLHFTSRKENASFNPAYWASLILIGDNSPIENPGILSGNWWWLPGASILCFLLWFLWRKRRSAKSLAQH